VDEKSNDKKLPITRVILACDESGAKAYADANDLESDDIGVFAGVMVPEEVFEAVKQAFDAVAAPFKPAEGKLHITDLPPDKQAALRAAIYEVIRAHALPCFYEAMHVAGFNARHGELLSLVGKARAARRSPIKMSANPPEAPSMHVTMFEGLYGQILAFCMERNKHRVHITVRTDRVDELIKKWFAEAAAKLTDYSATTKTVKGFDPAAKKPVKGTVTAGETPHELRLPITVEGVELRIVDDDDGLVLAADVLANSLRHLFLSRRGRERYRALNTREAVANHPLYDCLDSFWRRDGYNHADDFYGHPKDPARAPTKDPCGATLCSIVKRFFEK